MLKTTPIQIPASTHPNNMDGRNSETGPESIQPIILPSPKKVQKSSNKPMNKNPDRTSLQVANDMFDPNNASPNTEFMQLLKHRMNVYYEQDVCMFS